MKQIKRILPLAIIAALLLALAGCGAEKAPEAVTSEPAASEIAAPAAEPAPYVGTWQLAIEKNDGIEPDLFFLFGSSLHAQGAGLTITEDGAIEYFLGLTGGTGTYTVEGDTITAEVTSYIESAEETLTFRYVEEDGVPYIVYDMDDDNYAREIWWEK